MYFAVAHATTFDIELYDPADFKNVVGLLVGHLDSVACLAFAAHVPRLASADEHNIKVWDTDTMSEMMNLTNPDSSLHMPFDQTGPWLAADNDEKRVWDNPETMDLPYPASEIRLAFDHSGTQLISTISVTRTRANVLHKLVAISKWDLQAQSRTLRIDAGTKGEFCEAYFVDSDRKITSVIKGDYELSFWDAESGAELAKVGMGARVNGIAKSGDEVTGAVAMNDGRVALVDFNSGLLIRCLSGHHDCARSVCFSGDGLLVAAVSFDGNVTMWDVASGSIVSTVHFHEAVLRVSLNFDGTKVALCYYSVCVVELQERVCVLRHAGAMQGQFSRVGMILM
jgi:WD40 repeat protein